MFAWIVEESVHSSISALMDDVFFLCIFFFKVLHLAETLLNK